MLVPDPGPVSPRFLTQDDRIAIADGLQAGTGVKQIAASIGKSFQTIYREIERNSKPGGCYQPWWADNQGLLRRARPKGTEAPATGQAPGSACRSSHQWPTALLRSGAPRPKVPAHNVAVIPPPLENRLQDACAQNGEICIHGAAHAHPNLTARSRRSGGAQAPGWLTLRNRRLSLAGARIPAQSGYAFWPSCVAGRRAQIRVLCGCRRGRKLKRTCSVAAKRASP